MLDLLMNRRSIRKYKEKKIDPKAMDQIIKGALTAPSGRNAKPWELIVVSDRELLSALGASRGAVSSHMKDAGVGMIVLADPNVTDLWVEDASIMATIIQLQAQSLGLGSCWIQVRERINSSNESVEEHIKKLLHIPENLRVECMLAIGYPDEEKQPYTVEDLPYHKVHYNNEF